MVSTGGDKMFEFSENLKRIRESRRISKSEVAKAIGVSQPTYLTYENGRNAVGDREPSLAILIKIADFFGMSVDTLLGHRTQNYLSQWSTTGFYFENEGDRVILKSTVCGEVNRLLEGLSPQVRKTLLSFSKEEFENLRVDVLKRVSQLIVHEREKIIVEIFNQRISAVVESIEIQ